MTARQGSEGGGDEMLCRASSRTLHVRKVPKRKPRLSCRGFSLYHSPVVKRVRAKISLARKLVKRGGTGATKWLQANLGRGVAWITQRE
jgi:hypothetical protein